MDVKIRYIKKSEIKKLLFFNKANYHPGHILINRKYLDWQFGSFPSKSKNYSILGAFQKTKLLGVIGLTFLDYSCFNKKVRCTSLANLMVDKRFRNLGLGYLLLSKAEKINPIAIDHGVNNNAMQIFSALGWTGKNLQRYAFVFDAENIKRVVGGKNFTLNNSIGSGLSVGGFKLAVLKQYNKRLVAFFEYKNIKDKYPVTVDRTKEYLNWRYFKHHLIKYNIFAAVNNEKIASFMVVRIEGPKYFRVARIIDFVSSSEAEVFTLNAILDFCRQEKVKFIDYYFSGNFHIKNLKRMGFIDCSEGAYSLLPKFLNPIVAGGETGINFIISINNRFKNKNIREIKNWYTTKGGGDQDRGY